MVHILGRYSRQAHLLSRINAVLAARGGVVRSRLESRRVHARLSVGATHEITQQYSEGVSMSAMSRSYGISTYSLRMVLAREGVLSCGESMSEESIQLALGLHASGVSVMEIARQVGVPDSTLRLVLARHTAS